MKRYTDYKEDPKRTDLTEEEFKKVNWTKYKIVVPTEDDKKEIMEAIEEIHYSEVDSDVIAINQIIHEYLEGTNIVVDPDLYNDLDKK